nr:hypothetical protein [Tanacetum cinerariifolium]
RKLAFQANNRVVSTAILPLMVARLKRMSWKCVFNHGFAADQRHQELQSMETLSGMETIDTCLIILVANKYCASCFDFGYASFYHGFEPTDTDHSKDERSVDSDEGLPLLERKWVFVTAFICV